MGISIGGSASNSGVVFHGEYYKASFKMDNNDQYTISHSRLPPIQGMKSFIAHIPFVRGLAALFARPFLGFTIVLNTAVEFASRRGLIETWFGGDSVRRVYFTINAVLMILILALTIFVIKTILYKTQYTRMYHGAEHKVVYALINDIPLELDRVRACPRIADRCGTNLVVFILLFVVAFSFVLDFASLRLVLGFILGYELFDLENGHKLPVIKFFYVFGGWCQQRLFTREPTDIQLAAAIDTAKVLVELEESAESEEGDETEEATEDDSTEAGASV